MPDEAETKSELPMRINALVKQIQKNITQTGDVKTGEILIDIQSMLKKISDDNDEFALGLAETAIIAATHEARNFQLADITYNKLKQALGEDRQLIKKITENNNSNLELYFGLLSSFIIFTFIASLAVFFFHVNNTTYMDIVFKYPHGVYALVLYTAIAGILGSIISVLYWTYQIRSSEEAKSDATFLGGFFRPVIGLAIGPITYMALKGEALGITLTAAKDNTNTLAYIDIAFFAGFSERFGILKTIQDHVESKSSHLKPPHSTK
jgi:hypothetical protein